MNDKIALLSSCPIFRPETMSSGPDFSVFRTYLAGLFWEFLRFFGLTTQMTTDRKICPSGMRSRRGVKRHIHSSATICSRSGMERMAPFLVVTR